MNKMQKKPETSDNAALNRGRFSLMDNSRETTPIGDYSNRIQV